MFLHHGNHIHPNLKNAMGKKTTKKPVASPEVDEEIESQKSDPVGDEDQQRLLAILTGGAHDSEEDEVETSNSKSKKQKKEEMRAAKQNKNKKADKGKKGEVKETTPEVANIEEVVAPASDAEDASMDVPLRMVYCPVCTFPPEMCEYGGMFAQCKEHWESNPDAPGASEALGGSGDEDKGRKRKLMTAGEKACAAVSKGGRKTVLKEIIMTVEKRQGRKFNTHIANLDLFGVDLKEACTIIKKALATGATVSDDPSMKHLRITVQGDVVRDLATILPQRLGVPAEALFLVNGSNKTQLRPLTGCIDLTVIQTKPEKKKAVAPVVAAQPDANLTGDVRAVQRAVKTEDTDDDEEEEEEEEEETDGKTKHPFKAAKKEEVVVSRKPRFEVDDDGKKIMAPSFVPTKNRNKRK